MTVTSLVQVAQRATNLGRAVEFYGSTLGLTLIARFDEADMAFFKLGSTRLLLGTNHYSSSLYLGVDDIYESFEALTARGVRFEHEPRRVFSDDNGQFGVPGTEEWMAFLWDSEENMVGLVERRSPASDPVGR